MLEIIEEAARIVGGTGKLATALGCTRQAICQWDKVPRGRAVEIELITEGKITRHQMRPDLFPPQDRSWSVP